MAKAKRKRRVSFRTMEADSAVSALDEFERLEQVEAQRRAALVADGEQQPADNGEVEPVSADEFETEDDEARD